MQLQTVPASELTENYLRKAVVDALRTAEVLADPDDVAPKVATLTGDAGELLADPGQIALLRDLFAHARKVRAEHATYAFDDHLGHPIVAQEHTWTAGHDRVSYEDGHLRFLYRGKVRMVVKDVKNVRQAAQLLAAIGVLPERFAGARVNEPTNPDRRCRNCGATSGLRLLHSNPLTLAAREWECHNGCAGGAR